MKGVGIVRRGQLSLYAGLSPMDARAGGARGAAARRATWLSTLGPGAVLGVASLSPELRRDWYAEAASTVDLLSLQKADLKRILGSEKLQALREEFRFMVDYLEGRHGEFSTDEQPPVIEESCSHDEPMLTKTRSFATATKGAMWVERSNSVLSHEAVNERTAKRPATAGPVRRTATMADGERSRRPQSAAPGPRRGSTERSPDQWSGSQFSAHVIFTPELCDPVDRSNAASGEQRANTRGAREVRRKAPGARVEKMELGLAWQLVLRERQRSIRLNLPSSENAFVGQRT
ncbi:hypothetical protein KFL_004220120 [Klebsormidium nitens]|uniref:Cyclic nucleotide-binding domain-containing protein n=1 Tax=Klebsormidium nitens TaxID=105231 RepID=A0A1Y1ICQ7_KLENI|nr:hypothetical protein KFL_004220120 [Klebsormidium nitens]|eukprot:GAQ88373.1 hypothetical protein KFL_004220120 [Klebsormidium nitens]